MRLRLSASRAGALLALLFWVSPAATAQPRAAENAPPTAAPFPVTISVDAAKRVGAMKPVWRFFGADEPNYAYMKDGSKLVGELGQLHSGVEYFRAHNLLTSGDG